MDLINRLAHNRVWGIVLIAGFVLAAYSFMLRAPFRSMDDTTTIVENQYIRDFSNLPQIFTSAFFGDHSYYRPLVAVSFMTEYAIFGLEAFWFNFNNVILHIINSLLVLFLCQRLCGDKTWAFMSAFLFAIHPVQWEAVSNISGRSILLSALFVFLSFLLFIEFDRRRKIFWLAGSIVSFFLGILCKESAAILPAVLGLYLWLISPHKNKPWLSLVLFVGVVIGFLQLRQLLGITQLFGWGSWDAALLGFLSFIRGCITYLRLYVLPVDLYFDRSQAVFTSFVDPQLLVAVIFWMGALFAVWRMRVRMNVKILFCLVWFGVELAPVSQIVTSLGVQPGYISLAEHFLYVPTAAMAVVLVGGALHMAKFLQHKNVCSPAMMMFAAVGIVAFLYLTTIQQTVYASNELSMLKRSIAMQPNNSRVLYSLGMNYVNRGMFEEAHSYFQTAVQVDPWNARAKIALGKVLCDLGRYQEGLNVYRGIEHPGSFAEILKENMSLTEAIIQRQKILP